MNKRKKLSITNYYVFESIKIFISILIALFITFIVLCLIYKDISKAFNAFSIILLGPLSKSRYFGIVIEKTIPYSFAGLAAGLLFRSGSFNLGVEGIYIISGVSISAIATSAISGSNIVHPTIAILAGALTGGILMMIPAFLKSKFSTNEMVSSLMLNSIYAGLANYLVRTYLLNPDASTIGTHNFYETAKIGYIFEKYKITAFFFVLIIITILIYLLLFKTKFGYEIRLFGTNKRFAEYSGINAFKISLLTAFIAGCLAGIGSASQLLTQTNFYIPAQSVTGIGFTGLLLAMLGRNHPIGIVVAAFFIQYLEQGTRVLYFSDSTIPSEIVGIVEAVVILLISSQYFLKGLREKQLLKEGIEENAK